jgi:hypothetical protein
MAVLFFSSAALSGFTDRRFFPKEVDNMTFSNAAVAIAPAARLRPSAFALFVVVLLTLQYDIFPDCAAYGKETFSLGLRLKSVRL